MDLFIAATAWMHGYDIVTYNISDFAMIASLLPAASPRTSLQVHHPDSL